MNDSRNWIRVMALALACATVVAIVEARTIRSLRAELGALRAARDLARAGTASRWSEPHDEFVAMGRWLHTFYADAEEGFGRADGLCPDGSPDLEVMSRWVLGEFMAARAAGASPHAAAAAMDQAIRRSPEYRALHPDLALPLQAK